MIPSSTKNSRCYISLYFKIIYERDSQANTNLYIYPYKIYIYIYIYIFPFPFRNISHQLHRLNSNYKRVDKEKQTLKTLLLSPTSLIILTFHDSDQTHISHFATIYTANNVISICKDSEQTAKILCKIFHENRCSQPVKLET